MVFCESTQNQRLNISISHSPKPIEVQPLPPKRTLWQVSVAGRVLDWKIYRKGRSWSLVIRIRCLNPAERNIWRPYPRISSFLWLPFRCSKQRVIVGPQQRKPTQHRAKNPKVGTLYPLLGTNLYPAVAWGPRFGRTRPSRFVPLRFSIRYAFVVLFSFSSLPCMCFARMPFPCSIRTHFAFLHLAGKSALATLVFSRHFAPGWPRSE